MDVQKPDSINYFAENLEIKKFISRLIVNFYKLECTLRGSFEKAFPRTERIKVI